MCVYGVLHGRPIKLGHRGVFIFFRALKLYLLHRHRHHHHLEINRCRREYERDRVVLYGKKNDADKRRFV